MKIHEARMKIQKIEQNLLTLRDLIYLDADMLIDGSGNVSVSSDDEMSEIFPRKNEKVQSLWHETLSLDLPGYSFDPNLNRHFSWNQVKDWRDIYSLDIPKEITKIEEYKRRLYMVEYITKLHSEVSKVAPIILTGDFDSALKSVYATLDATIRDYLKLRHGEQTVPSIGKAFNDGVLCAPHHEDNGHARNFLQGVIGYFRSNILHNSLSAERSKLESNLSLFAVAHEAFVLFDICKTDRN